jgi:hypothetical protein
VLASLFLAPALSTPLEIDDNLHESPLQFLVAGQCDAVLYV